MCTSSNEEDFLASSFQRETLASVYPYRRPAPRSVAVLKTFGHRLRSECNEAGYGYSIVKERGREDSRASLYGVSRGRILAGGAKLLGRREIELRAFVNGGGAMGVGRNCGTNGGPFYQTKWERQLLPTEPAAGWKLPNELGVEGRRCWARYGDLRNELNWAGSCICK